MRLRPSLLSIELTLRRFLVTGSSQCVNIKTEDEFAVKIISRNIGLVRLVKVLQDSCHTYVVTELLRGGELFRRIRQKKRFTEHEPGSWASW